LLALAASACLLAGAQTAQAGTVPSGFQDTVAFSGLTNPTTFNFAPDGRVFVGEKSGLIKVFDGPGDNSATTVADLRTDTDNFWDRGLLGMTLDPQFPTRPYLYVLYTRDALPGGNSPKWGSAGVDSDPCPTPPGATTDGCVATGRLARLTISGNTSTAQTNLITDWCQQYPSHSVGDLAFGQDGQLYVSGGEGASFTFADWGQAGNPVNPCGDPPGAPGSALSPPTAEGGSLRSQDARSTLDPTGLDGSILRVDPDTGAGSTGNPFAASADANQRRIVGFGMRNPFRFAFRPGTNEVWAGDVGQDNWEEIDRLVTPADSTADNFGWPCYEGVSRQASWDGANLNLCETLYSSGGVVAPYYTYNHGSHVVNGESCSTGSSSLSGMAFSQAGSYPTAYNGALFFSDYSRKCIWAMFPGSNGLPDPSNIQNFDSGAAGPVKIAVGPQGELYYADLDGGTIHRIVASGSPPPPPPGGDLALNRSSSSSSVEEAGLESDKANDGNPATRWSSAFADNQWWQVDLGSAQQVDTVKLNWEDAYASHYQILTSTDGTNFTQAADVTNAQSGLKTTSFAARSARYVRVLGITRATPYGFSFWDAEVYGPSQQPPPSSDLALNKTATAQSVEEPGLEANKGNDGNSSTRWSSAFADNQWWQVDLGSAQQVDTVKLNWEDAYATHYLIQTSTDGTNFTQAADVVNAAPGLKTTTFTARSARYVRVLGLTRATQYGFSFWDAQVYGPTGTPANQPPNAVATATPSNGAAPLNVQLSASGSTDPDDAANTLTYAWDADGDGQFDDGNQATVNFSYPAGTYTATVKVTDPHGASDTDSVPIQAGNTAPTATITTPPSSLTWKVGDPISFAATATDAQETLPASAYHWQEIVNHCPSNCHQHFIQDFFGTSGSLIAPDHEYPSTLELRLTVTDSGGLTDVKSVILNPKTVGLTLASAPAGLQLGLNTKTATAPFTSTLIQGSQNTVIAPTPQTLNANTYAFGSWSDLGAASHNVTVNQNQTLTATYNNTTPTNADKALNQPTSASSVEEPGLEANKANDGNSNTRWSSNWTNNQWWQVDLGRTRKVDKVTLNWETAYAKSYRIQTSTNGTTFTQAASVSITAPGVKTTTFTARDARYVRILGVTRATQWGISFWDASVFGPAD
jgi:glucose/arabinose dehydrogenase